MSAHPVEQSIRKSHCAHAERDDPAHKCCGTCTISPSGVTLECRLCGDDYTAEYPYAKRAEKRAESIIASAGLAWKALSAEQKQAVVREVTRAFCPGCGHEAPAVAATPYGPFHACPCGKWEMYDYKWSSRR